MFDLYNYAVLDSYHYTKLRVIEFCQTSNEHVTEEDSRYETISKAGF